MTDRDRLTELIGSKVCEEYSPNCDEWEPHSCGNCYANNCHIKDLADHLLANGVIVPPCKVGDMVYYVHETYLDNDYKNKVLNDNVRNRILKIVERKNYATNLALEVIRFDYCFITDWLKGDIFLTKEEAEEKLKEYSNGTT